jgi:hypothetical protein
MDATGHKNSTPVDQASELRKLAAGRVTPTVSMTVAEDRTQAASLILLARLVREKSGVAA